MRVLEHATLLFEMNPTTCLDISKSPGLLTKVPIPLLHKGPGGRQIAACR